jgi:hypothetical protein
MDRSYADHIECSEAIARYLTANVPAGWSRIEASVRIEHDIEMVTSELKYWPLASALGPEWFAIEDAEEDVEFGNCFIQLALLIRGSDNDLFKQCVFSLSPDGRFHAKYEY